MARRPATVAISSRTELSLTLLGEFSARRNGDVPLRLERRKAAALLAYLAMSGGRVHPRDKLAALLWPDARETGARHSLRQALVTLRQALPPRILRVDELTVALDPDAVDVDVIAFQRLVADGAPAALARAAALYGGDFLAGLDVNEAPFEEWLQSERERLRELAVGNLARLLAWQRETDDLDGAVQTALHLLGLDPLQEVVHRTVMRLHVARGRRNAALRQYQVCVDVLRRELGVEPEPETRELYGAILRQRGLPPPVVDDGRRPRATEPPPHDLDASEPDHPIVGREAELAALDRMLGESAPGRQRLVIVLGEAGIGKSRLLAELRARALARGARVMLGRSYESAQIVPFVPWIGAIRRSGALDEPSVRDLSPLWRRELVRLLPEFGGEYGEDPADTLSDVAGLFEAVAQVLEHLAARQPMVAMLEDIHWADEMTLRLLAFLARRPRTVPLVVVASARDDELGDAGLLRTVLAELAADRRLERLALAPLSRAATGDLVSRLSRQRTEAATVAALADRLWDATHGQPFMIVETMNALEDTSHDALAGSLPLPQRVHDLIASRLDRLTPAARTLVGVAAVIGGEFEFALLRQASGLDEAVAANALEELVRRRMLGVVDDRFDFTHARIRDVALSGLLPPRRRILHRQVAEALEAMAPGGADRDSAALATHCREAGLWENAARHFREAGRTAASRSAEREAAACFDEALAALQHASRTPSVLEQTVDLNLDLRNSLLVLGQIGRLPACLNAAETAARTLGDPRRQSWVSLYRAQFEWWTGVSRDARVFAEHAERIVDASDDRSLKITGGVYAGFAWSNAGEYRRARRALDRSLELLAGEPPQRRHGHQSLPLPFARGHLARICAELGDFAEGVRHGLEGLRVAEEAGHRPSMALVFSNLGHLYSVQGDTVAAMSAFSRAHEIERERQLWQGTAGGVGYCYVLTGRTAEGIALMEEVRAAMDTSGWRLLKARMLATLGHAYLLGGRGADAQACADESLALARDRGERGCEAWALWLQGEIAAQRDPLDFETATERFRQGRALAAELGMRPVESNCLYGLARVHRSAGRPDAEHHLLRATTLAREIGMSAWRSGREPIADPVA